MDTLLAAIFEIKSEIDEIKKRLDSQVFKEIVKDIKTINERLDKIEGNNKPFYDRHRNKLVSTICFSDNHISFCDKVGYFTSKKFDNPRDFKWDKFNYANTVKLFVSPEFSTIDIYIYAIRFLILKGYKISKFDSGWPNDLYFTKD